MTFFDPAYLPPLSPEELSHDISGSLLNTTIVLIVFQTLFVVLFYISQYLSKAAHGATFQCFIILSWIFCTINCVNGVLMVKTGGAGRHAAFWLQEDPQKIKRWLKHAKAEEFIYMAAVTAPKLAILALYLRVFTTRPYRISVYTIGAFVVLTWLSSLICNLLICRPFAAYWDHTIQGGHCGDIMAAHQYISVPNLVSDFMTLILPLPAIYKLHVELPAKIGLFITFTLGSFGIITSIIRTVEFFNNELFPDPTFKSVTTMKWSLLEPGAYLIAACLPSLRPFKRIILPNTSISELISTRIFRSSSQDSQKSLSKDNCHIYRTRRIELVSTEVVKDGQDSTRSTAGFCLPSENYVELDSWQVERGDEFVGRNDLKQV